nr:hypothetical protein GCM10017611_28380 [Rhodococcus wratislaviensis]
MDEDTPGRSTVISFGHGGLQNPDTLSLVMGEGVRVRVGLRADEPFDRVGGPRPVDEAVLGSTLVEERGLRAVLRRPVRATGRDQLECVEGDRADHVDGAVEQIGDGVCRPDGRRPLQNDVAGVEFLVHQVRGEAYFFLTVDERPDERGESCVLGQERVVNVEGAVAGRVEDVPW